MRFSHLGGGWELTNRTISVLLIIAIVFSSTGIVRAEKENLSLMDQFEISIGTSTFPALVEQYGGIYELPLHQRQRLNEVFARVVAVTDRKELTYSLTVLDTYDVNAFALPGGFIFITKGMLRNIGDDEHVLAAVLGHELAHVEKKHGLNAVLKQLGLFVLIEVSLLWLKESNNELLRTASTVLMDLLQSGWGREAEYEADFYGQVYAAKAGFDPSGAVHLVDHLLAIEGDDQPKSLFQTHPPTPQRRARLEEALLNFWGEPEPIAPVILETKDVNSDPKGRYDVYTNPENNDYQLRGYDHQLEKDFAWLVDHKVKQAQWSPNGKYLAVVVEINGYWEIWLLNRLGNVAIKWRINDINSRANFTNPTWSPDGRMLAYTKDGEVFVGYIEGSSTIPVGRAILGTNLLWNENGLVIQNLHDEAQFYLIKVPDFVPLTISNPIPQVIQRRSNLTPSIVQENGKFRIQIDYKGVVLP